MTPGPRPLVAGNWKMNGTLREAAALAWAVRAGLERTPGRDLLLCPPFLHLPAVAAALEGSGVSLGGQDCHPAASGAHTGDVSAPMLRDAGASHVLLGHSERRAGHGETDDLVRAKVEAALSAGLVPVVCVGETEPERDSGGAERVVEAQLLGSLPEGFAMAGGTVAYEPVWAIGTGRTPSEAEVAALHARIRAVLIRRFPKAGGEVRILYGGSVKPSNAGGLLALPEVDGALVGGASLRAEDFLGIAEAAPAG